MLLNCPVCKDPVGGDAIDYIRSTARCNQCRTTFRIRDGIDETFYENNIGLLVMPEGVELAPGLQLDIKLNWRKLGRVGYHLRLGLVMTIPLILALNMTYHGVGEIIGGVAMALFSLIGLYYLFTGISLLFNTTHISASYFGLEIKHHPINFLGWKNHLFRKEEILQLFVLTRNVGGNRTKEYVHDLHLLLNTWEEKILIRNLKSAEVAFYLENQIEKRLGIKDVPVEDELSSARSKQYFLLQSLDQREKMPRPLRNIVEEQLTRQRFK